MLEMSQQHAVKEMMTPSDPLIKYGLLIVDMIYQLAPKEVMTPSDPRSVYGCYDLPVLVEGHQGAATECTHPF